MIDIQIVNWLITRRCPYKCDYCGIVSDSINNKYPKISHYNKNEMSSDYIIEVLNKFKKINKNIFHIFYGGEIALFQDLYKIIDHCNKENIFYTIITTNVKKVFHDLIKRNIEVRGLTTSIDVMTDVEKETDRRKKTESSLMSFIDIIETGKVKDPVAEITLCSDKEVFNLKNHILKLSAHGITSSITLVDPSKNEFYDFSKISKKINIDKNKLKSVFNTLLKNQDKYKVHMPDVILPMLIKYHDATYRCNIDKKVTNLTIDADGTVRLCLRIRGIETPKIAILEYLKHSKTLNLMHKYLTTDYHNCCQKCLWTCQIMSNHISENKKQLNSLTHKK